LQTTGTETSTRSVAQVEKEDRRPPWGWWRGRTRVLELAERRRGGVRTRTTKLAVEVWPRWSVAEQETVVSTSRRTAPGRRAARAGKQETGRLPSTASLAVTS
jgi:hypothetical protein